MKKILAVVIGVGFLVFAGVAGAMHVTSLPGGTVIPMPYVDKVGVGPETFDGVTWTSTFGTSLFGYIGPYGFASNGGWTGSLGPMAGLDNWPGGTMTFAFATPVSGVGGFMNYAAWEEFDFGIPVIAVYDSSNNLIENYTLNFDTGNATDSGFFHGFWEDSATIKYFTLSNAYIGITNLTTTATPVPIPSAIYLFGTGLVGLVGLGRKRLKK